jgi:hypothetical protein
MSLFPLRIGFEWMGINESKMLGIHDRRGLLVNVLILEYWLTAWSIEISRETIQDTPCRAIPLANKSCIIRAEAGCCQEFATGRYIESCFREKLMGPNLVLTQSRH